MSAIGAARDTVRSWLVPVMHYERHIAAAAMVVGFGVDSYTFGRIDRPAAHIVFAAYLLVAGGTIAAAHSLQSRADRQAAMLVAKLKLEAARMPPDAALALANASPEAVEKAAEILIAQDETKGDAREPRPSRWRTWLPAATQFALGGLWSGFLVFYSRSASLAVSWLFLATLVAFLVGNEAFKKYHSRLVFATLLFFFAIYSYAVFALPVVTRTIGKVTFLASGVLALLFFMIFLRLLERLGKERFKRSRWQIFGGTVAIAGAMNLFYFTSILPPLPLALANAGVYHTVKRTGAVYSGVTEKEPWYTAYGIGEPVYHLTQGQPLSVYSAVFAPIKLTTRIIDRWQWYDETRRHWITEQRSSFAISGGREGGYRAYTINNNPKPGDWRVDIETLDGRLIGRLKFAVASVPTAAPTVPVTVN